MPDQTKSFYENIAADYHLISSDWNKSIDWHAGVLDKLITKYRRREGNRLLDCTCGIGTQIIGLAKLGYQASGSDLSAKSVRRARKESARRGLQCTYQVSDVRKLPDKLDEKFDIIISCDNALPHLMTEEELGKAAFAIFSLLESDGLFIAGIRDYDAELEKKPAATPVNSNAERITFQLWDWYKDDEYELEHIILKRKKGKLIPAVGKARYKAYRRETFAKVFGANGFTDISWLMPDESSYYQPVMIAYKQK